MYDEKKRPEVGFQDMDKYDFGGFEIDEQLTNGYHLYVPYGIHTDFFNAIDDSIRTLQNQRQKCIDNIKSMKESLEDFNKDKDAYKYVRSCEYIIQIQEDDIKRIDKDLKILEKFIQLKNEV